MATQSYSITIKYPRQSSNNKCKPNSEAHNNTIPNNDNGAINSESSENSSASTVMSVIKTVKNPMSALIGTTAKALAPVAVTLAVVKLADSVVNAVIPYYVGYTGDVNAGINYANFKSAISGILNPIGTLQSYATKQMEVYQESLKIEERRALTGNSIINNYGGKTSN